MRINKYWSLIQGSAGYLRPTTMLKTRHKHLHSATKKQFDKVAIYHTEANGGVFYPIIFADKYVSSKCRWEVKDFFRQISEIIRLYKGGLDETPFNTDCLNKHWVGWSYKGRISWGCRLFTIKQLEEIKALMLESYVSKELRGTK